MRLLGSLLTLFALLATYGIYSVVVVPWVDDTPPGVLPPDIVDVREAPAVRFEQILRSHFPEGSWERGEVNVLRTRQLLLVWKAHETVEDRRLRVHPLSIVLMDNLPSRGASVPDKPGSHGRTWILRAPAGALLQFDQDLNLSSGQFGRFHSGFIPGAVTALGAPAAQGIRPFPAATTDDQPIEILTRNLQFDDRRIWTSEEVSFHWGSSFGSGRDLMITMSPETGETSVGGGLPGSSVESLRLMRLDRLHVATPSRTDRITDSTASPWDVTAHGPLQVDLLGGVCRLTERVKVERRAEAGGWDRLQCDALTLQISDARASVRGGSRSVGSASSGLPRYTVTGVIAEGKPLTLESSLESPAGNEQRSLEATSIRYQFATDANTAPTARGTIINTHGPGGAEIVGPGRMILRRDTEPNQQVELRFAQAVQWMPHGEGGHLNIVGNTQCTAAGVGGFSAEGLELQLRQDNRSSLGWQPIQMRGIGNVQIQSARLQVTSRDLHATFIEGNALPDTSPQGLQLNGPGNATEPAVDLNSPSGPRLEMQGDRIELTVAGFLPRLGLQAAALIGEVRCRELPNEPAARPRASLAGDEVRFVDLGNRHWRVDVTGKPAIVASDQVELTGTNIHVDTQRNRAWMDGPGLANLPMPTQFGPSPSSDAQRAQLTWNRDMEFDGSQLVCRDRVSCRGPYQLLRGELLRLVLAQPIRLNQLPAQQFGIELATTILEGSVFCENRTVEAEGLQSIDTAQLHQLRYDHPTGRLEGVGPGWVETVRRGGTGWSPGATPLPVTDSEFRFLRVDFERNLQGDLRQREVRFGDFVRTVYGPVPDWSDRIIATHRDELPADGLLLQCRELIVLQGSGGVPTGRPLEMLALGDTTIDGREFTATAERLSYDQAKDLLILEGNDRTQAQIWYQARSGDKQSKEVAKKILYRPKTKELKIEGLQFLEFRTTGK